LIFPFCQFLIIFKLRSNTRRLHHQSPAKVPSAAPRCPQHLPSDSRWSSRRPHTERSCAGHPWCCTGRPPVLGFFPGFFAEPKGTIPNPKIPNIRILNIEVLGTTKQFSCKVDMDQESSLLNNLMSFRPGNTASRCIYGIDLWTYVL
jgi:hypothetical protein